MSSALGFSVWVGRCGSLWCTWGPCSAFGLLAWSSPWVLWAAKVGVATAALLAPLLTLVALPGMWFALVVAGLAEWVTAESLFSTTTLVGCAAVAGLGELWEFGASSLRAKRAGAGHRGTLGALVGGIFGAILGTIVLPLVGTIVVGGLGALVGSFLLERSGGRSFSDAIRVGRAAAAGQMLGVVGKLALACAMSLWLAVAAFAA